MSDGLPQVPLNPYVKRTGPLNHDCDVCVRESEVCYYHDKVNRGLIKPTTEYFRRSLYVKGTA